jgi:hypothetical protein
LPRNTSDTLEYVLSPASERCRASAVLPNPKARLLTIAKGFVSSTAQTHDRKFIARADAGGDDAGDVLHGHSAGEWHRDIIEQQHDRT